MVLITSMPRIALTMNNLPKKLTKGGPGDKSKPGNINTDAWFTDPNAAAINPELIASIKNKDIWFCDIPFNHIYSNIDGTYAVCCHGSHQEEHNVNNTSIIEWMEESEYMNSIRKEMLDPNSKHEAVNKICKKCRYDENKYGRSRRTNCLKIHTNDANHWNGIQKTVELYKTSGMYGFDDRSIEIQLKVFGSECNIDCHMCIHANSTTRTKVAKDGLWSNELFGDKEKVFSITDSIKNIDNAIKQIIELVAYIRSIKIIGGEALIMKKHYKMLNELVKTGHASKIGLKYQTNLTKLKSGKHHLLTYIPKFSTLSIISIYLLYISHNSDYL